MRDILSIDEKNKERFYKFFTSEPSNEENFIEKKLSNCNNPLISDEYASSFPTHAECLIQAFVEGRFYKNDKD